MKLTTLTLATAALLMPASFIANSASAEDTPVLVQFTMSDIPSTINHYKANIIGKMLSEFDFQALISQASSEFGADVPGSVNHGMNAFLLSKNGEFTVFGLSPSATPEEVAEFKKSPYFKMNANLGDAAKDYFAENKKDSENVEVPGFDEAFKGKDSGAIWGRKGNQLLVANYVKHMVPVMIKPTGQDLNMYINGQGIRDMIMKVAATENKGDQKEIAKIEKLLKSLDRLFVPFTGHFDIKDKHVLSRFAAKTTFPFLKGVDLTVCDKLPDSTYSVSAVGMDGKVLWNDMLLPVLTAVANMTDKKVEEALSEANQHLQDMGITVKIDEVISSVKGTIVFAQTKAAPFPGVTLAIPRSPAIDQVVKAALKTMNMELEKEGTPTMVMIPDLPMPMNLLSDATHWILSSDPQVMTDWQGRTGKGWLESSLGKLAQEKNNKDTVAVLVSDNKEELKVAQASLSMIIGFLPIEPKEQQTIMRGLNNLILNTGLSYESVTQKDGQIVSEGVGLIGGNTFPIIALSAGIVGGSFFALENKEFEPIILDPNAGDSESSKNL